jgi:hypothetical protein
MSLLVAIDPGIRGCGVAVFEGYFLTEAAYVKSPVLEGNDAAAAVSMASWVVGSLGLLSRHITELAVEWPRIYASRIRAGLTKEDPNDLLALTAVDTALAALLSPVKTVSISPSEWKGQMKKEPCQARIVSRLSPRELVVAEAAAAAAKSKAHNLFDAIGIGLHHLGRFARKRVIP